MFVITVKVLIFAVSPNWTNSRVPFFAYYCAKAKKKNSLL